MFKVMFLLKQNKKTQTTTKTTTTKNPLQTYKREVPAKAK